MTIMAALWESAFAKMSTDQFVGHLRSHNIEPTPDELISKPQYPTFEMRSGIAQTILNFTGQRSGESSAK